VTPTPSQTVGPFYAIGMCRRDENVLAPDGIELSGLLLDGLGAPVPDGVVELWDANRRAWGRCGTDETGRFRFLVPREAEALEALVLARGLLRHERTRIYQREAEDEVLAPLSPEERETLVAREDAGRLRFDIRLQGERATVFFAT
jgi:protocatechuate 3,4-dioxygenase alpha subunit